MTRRTESGSTLLPMSRRSRGTPVRLRAIAGICAVLLIVPISASGSDRLGRMVQADPGLPVAPLWVAPSGGSASCVRSVVPVGFAAALAGGNVCDSGQSAYVRAQLGDTVLVQ